MEFNYVTRDFKALTGAAAEAQLRIRNDKDFLTPNRGIVAVSRQRWEIAQDAERHGWMDMWSEADNDRNQHHFALFDYFAMFREHRFHRAIELGCGPFTNMQFIAAAVPVDHVELLDPLIQSYVDHRNCTYKGDALRLVNGQAVKVDAHYAMPIEDLTVQSTYDLVILVNVLEHCIDVDRVFQNIWNMLTPGGIFIFHDKYFYHAEVALRAATDYDTAHPLKPDRAFVDGFLDRFRSVFRRNVTTTGAAVMTAPGDAVYFIGQRP